MPDGQEVIISEVDDGSNTVEVVPLPGSSPEPPVDVGVVPEWEQIKAYGRAREAYDKATSAASAASDQGREYASKGGDALSSILDQFGFGRIATDYLTKAQDTGAQRAVSDVAGPQWWEQFYHNWLEAPSAQIKNLVVPASIRQPDYWKAQPSMFRDVQVRLSMNTNPYVSDAASRHNTGFKALKPEDVGANRMPEKNTRVRQAMQTAYQAPLSKWEFTNQFLSDSLNTNLLNDPKAQAQADRQNVALLGLETLGPGALLWKTIPWIAGIYGASKVTRALGGIEAALGKGGDTTPETKPPTFPTIPEYRVPTTPDGPKPPPDDDDGAKGGNTYNYTYHFAPRGRYTDEGGGDGGTASASARSSAGGGAPMARVGKKKIRRRRGKRRDVLATERKRGMASPTQATGAK